jgi:membrane protein DedA with SNARE-associated domain
MEDTFILICEKLSSHLWLQALLVVAGTCFLEDPARCGVGLLVVAGHIGWWLAFVSMTVGGMVGDLGLYVIGRYATDFLLRRRWIDAKRLVWMEGYFQRHAFKSVMLARFIPGARTLCYVSAGTVRYPMPRFTGMLFVAAVVQALLFLQVAAFIGSKLLPYLTDRRLQAAVFAVIILTLVLSHHVLARRTQSKITPLRLDAAP